MKEVQEVELSGVKSTCQRSILGMLTGSGALVTLGLYTFLRLETWSRILKLSAIGACIGAGNTRHMLIVQLL